MDITVVILNWNGRAWLPECLAAIAGQATLPAEVIVVDNGSCDGSLDYLRSSHPDIRSSIGAGGTMMPARLGRQESSPGSVVLAADAVVAQPVTTARYAVALWL